MSLEEAIAFYRQELAARGLVERGALTQITEGVFSFVFDGSPNGRAMVIQGVDLGGSTNISIRYEDV